MTVCNGCRLLVIDLEKITCSACSNVYHYGCVNITKENFSKLSFKTRSLWKCPVCKMPRKRGDNSNTPVKEDAVTTDEHIQQDTFEYKFNRFENSILSKMESLFRSEVEALQRDVKLIPELLKSIEFLSGIYDEVNSEVAKLRTESAALREENTKLVTCVKELSAKMNSIEQHLY